MNYVFWAAVLVVAALLFMIWKRPHKGPDPMESAELEKRFPRRQR
jgi:hypothetical protein